MSNSSRHSMVARKHSSRAQNVARCQCCGGRGRYSAYVASSGSARVDPSGCWRARRPVDVRVGVAGRERTPELSTGAVARRAVARRAAPRSRRHHQRGQRHRQWHAERGEPDADADGVHDRHGRRRAHVADQGGEAPPAGTSRPATSTRVRVRPGAARSRNCQMFAPPCRQEASVSSTSRVSVNVSPMVAAVVRAPAVPADEHTAVASALGTPRSAAPTAGASSAASSTAIATGTTAPQVPDDDDTGDVQRHGDHEQPPTAGPGDVSIWIIEYLAVASNTGY